MKPRLYQREGRWICFVVRSGMRKAAAGATPREAFSNWEARYA